MTKSESFFRKKFRRVNEKEIIAPISGVILDVKIKKGTRVKKGDVCLILDAMKMENELMSETHGTVKKINIKKGDRVNKNDILIVVS